MRITENNVTIITTFKKQLHIKQQLLINRSITTDYYNTKIEIKSLNIYTMIRTSNDATTKITINRATTISIGKIRTDIIFSNCNKNKKMNPTIQ